MKNILEELKNKYDLEEESLENLEQITWDYPNKQQAKNKNEDE